MPTGSASRTRPTRRSPGTDPRSGRMPNRPAPYVLALAAILVIVSLGAGASSPSAPGGGPAANPLEPTAGSSLGAAAPAAPSTPGAWLDWGDHDHARVDAVATPLIGAAPSAYGSPPSWLGYDSLHRHYYVPDAPSSV